jgi:uncharacterized membrane protein
VDKEFVNPNWHVVLLHVPLTLLILGTIIELFSFMWRRHGFRAAGRWMILLGALAGVPTITSGLYALRDVADPTHQLGTWKEVTAAGALNGPQWEMLQDHLLLMCTSVGLALLASIVWLASSDRLRARLHLPLLALLLGSAGTAIAGGWHGGEAVYRLGVAVEATRGSSATMPSTSEAGHMTFSSDPAYYFPPMQLHVILAGTVVAIGLAALGLSIRKITQGPPTTQVDYIAAALGPPPTLIGGEAGDAVIADPLDVATPRVPASRFWMLAALLGLLTAAAGYWTIARQMNVWSLNDLWNAVIREHVRLLAHTIAGVSIVVLAIILAMLARWAPRRGWILTIFAVLILACIGAQIWFGILLLFDTPNGGLMGFNG